MHGTILQIETLLQDSILTGDAQESVYQFLKTKFIEGNPYFMGVITLILVIGVAFCVERMIYLYLSQINTKKFLSSVEKSLNDGKLDEAKQTAKNTRGPIASICFQALERSGEDVDSIDKSITAYGSVQVSLLEKNLPWITLFIAAAPALGFLGTVMGMIEAFEQIQSFGDINPGIVAGGMKFALITTVGGLFVALVLQFLYNFILTRIDKITAQMEDASITILDLIIRYKKR